MIGPASEAPGSGSSRITIRDVARAAGVSVTTVSRALNGTGRMKGDTRERVRAAAAALGYRPNSLARGLVGRRSFAVGLLTSDTYGRFTLPIAAGLSEAMAERGVAVFLCAGGDDAERFRIDLEAMQDRRVDGLVLSGRRIDRALPVDLAGVGIPVLHVNTACPPGGIGFVPDDRAAAAAATRHLAALGRRRIACVTGPESFEASVLRARGWRDALDELGLAPPGEARFGTWSEAFGFAAARELLDGPVETRPDAVFCGNDQIARGLIDAVTAAGVDVPEALAVVGFDNWDIFAAATRPPLTSVDMELVELGREAGRTLLDLVDGRPVAPGLRRCACTLHVRDSCGAGRRPPPPNRTDRSPAIDPPSPRNDGAVRRDTQETNPMNRNTIPTLCALALCAGPAPALAAEFDMWVRSEAEGFLPKIVEAFNESSEHEATLQVVPAAELVQKYGISAAGGSAPDALSLDLIFTPSFAAAGQLQDMTDFAESLPYFEHLSPGHLAVGTREGRIYGLPYSADSSVLLINKALYRRAGLDPESPPTTWGPRSASTRRPSTRSATTFTASTSPAAARGATPSRCCRWSGRPAARCSPRTARARASTPPRCASSWRSTTRWSPTVSCPPARRPTPARASCRTSAPATSASRAWGRSRSAC